MSITREKLEQAEALVQKQGLDVWMTFVRETAGGSDPVLPLILDGGLTWQSALLVTKTGETVAVLGNYDADPLAASGDWSRVVPYVQDIRPELLAQLEEFCSEPAKIGINYSPDDVKADGLTHGMWLVLQKMLEGTRFANALVSAAPLVMELRGVKTAGELALMREALRETDRMFEDIAAFAKIGVTERAVYDHVHALAAERGLTFSWDPAGDPIVNSGPDSMIGHGVPSSTIQISEGHVFHIDLGLTKDGYSSDIQRCWYVGDAVPEDVSNACDAVNSAISAGAKVLKPGALGHEVDAAARKSIVASGYEEYKHALGHQVGRVAHDGGAVLGPQWERYGETPRIPIKEGEVYTLELGVNPAGRGYIGIEEMVVVTSDGCEFLSERQLDIGLLD